jgi:hypothetical protein
MRALPTDSIAFYADPDTATITADGVARANGVTGNYGVGSRVHVIADPPSGYVFSRWESSGVTVESSVSADTYATVFDNGWLKARFDGQRRAGVSQGYVWSCTMCR